MKAKVTLAALVALMFAMSGLFATAHAQEAQGQKFVNVIKQDGRPAQKVVYRANGAELFNDKQFIYTYDAHNRVTQVDINLWNAEASRWELRYTTTYTYGEDGFRQQMREFKIGTLQYEVIADQNKIREILAL